MRRICLAVAFVAITLASAARAQDERSFVAEGADVILGLGARQIAMGGTGTASASGLYGIYYNPALLSGLDGTQFSFSQLATAELRPYSFAGFSQELGFLDPLGFDATFAFARYPRVHARSTGVFDENDPESIFLRFLLPGVSGTYDGEIDSKTMVNRFALGVTPEAIPWLSIGVNLDYIDCETHSCGVHAGAAGYETRSVSATGTSPGAGVLLRLNPNWTLGANMSDIDTVLEVKTVTTDNNGTVENRFKVELPRRIGVELAYLPSDRWQAALGFQRYDGRYGSYDLRIDTVHVGLERHHNAHWRSRYGLWAPLEISATNGLDVDLPFPVAPTFGLGWEGENLSADLAIFAHPIMSYHLNRPAITAEFSLNYRF